MRFLSQKQAANLEQAVLTELKLARKEIRRGRFQRSMAIISAFAAIVSGFEAYLQHTRGAFSNRWMWTPVWLTPPMVAAAGAAIVSERSARRVLPVVSLASLVDGIIGFYYHLRGIQRLPGGFKLGLYNVVMGPPVFAPLLMSSVGVLGLLASSLRRERLADLEPGNSRARPAKRVEDTRTVGLRPATGIAGEVTQVERAVAHGRFQQGMALITAFFALLAGGEAYLEHRRGSYNNLLMWTPVAVTPPVLAAAAGAVRSRRIATTLLPFTSAISFLDGLLGFGLHLRGIKRMPGGFTNLQFNITLGPPLFAPLLFSAVGLLGSIAALLGRSEPV